MPVLPEINEDILPDASFEGVDTWELDGCLIISEQGNRTPMHGNKMLFGGSDDCYAWQMIDLLDLASEAHMDVMRLAYNRRTSCK